jgi:hypothetical protein
MVSKILTLLETPSTWSVFSRSKAALELRKKNPYGAVFNEIGEQLEKSGVLTLLKTQGTIKDGPFEVIPAQKVIPERMRLLGKEIVNYSSFHQSSGWRILPLKVEVKFSGVFDFPLVSFFDPWGVENGSAIPLELAVSLLSLNPKMIEQMWVQSIWISALIQSLFDPKVQHIESIRWAWAYDGVEGLRLASGSSLIPWECKYLQQDSERIITERVLSCGSES